MEKFIEKMVELLDTDHEITMDTYLKDIEEWDSLSVVSFAVMADIEYEKKLTALQVREAKKVSDLYVLVC